MKRVYLSGPMTGMPDLNFPAFMQAAKALRSRGMEVINPAEVDQGPNPHWASCMRKDLPLLCDCDGIVLLDGWEHSRGARLELHVALALGMSVQALAVALEKAEPGPEIVVKHVKTGQMLARPWWRNESPEPAP